ncbi:MAG: methyl-accepting chemotaxis protein [Paracoccaceae bacterium]
MSPKPQNPPGNAAAGDPLVERRSLIDLIATTRARAMRVAYFGTLLARPTPTNPEDEATRQNYLNDLAGSVEALNRVCAIVDGHDPLDQLPMDICTWIAEYSGKRSEDKSGFKKFRDLVRSIHGAAQDQSKDQERLLEKLHVYNRDHFFKMVTNFCDGLWNEIDIARQDDLARAQQSTEAILRTLTQLEKIGKHVRLVSLNASVEAARVGDAARGLGVIATEFKSLAEKIQNLSLEARDEIAEMSPENDSVEKSANRPASTKSAA